ESLVGMTGVALMDMHPVGDIEVDGETFEALAEHVWIDAGTPIIVTRADGLEIKVRPATG
ncbi:MAG TPA: nodulation protein NfeD, partial [Phycisphaerales bacterium]|nr:nodulation protein NfeD [Phycisphaerales bacterium]